MLRSAAAALFLVALAPLAEAQRPWPTTEWYVVEEGILMVAGNPDSTVPRTNLVEVEPPRDQVARLHERELQGVSEWFERLGFKAPPMERHESGAYRGRLKNDESSIVSSTNGDPRTELFMRLSSRPDLSAPEHIVDKLMARAGSHELFHAVAWAYQPYGRFANANKEELPMCGAERGGTDHYASSWLMEGAASALQTRWIERQEGRTYRHHYDDPSRAAWMRYFDQPLHRPHLGEMALNPARRAAEYELGRSWKCGYGTWYFWYALGEMLGDDLDEKVKYLRYILDSNGSTADGGLGYVDNGIKNAALMLEAPQRYRQGLYAAYPEFIAEHANDWRFYENPEPVELEGERGIVWGTGDLEPLSTQAWIVRVDVPDHLGEGRSIPLHMTLAETPLRDQLHLIVDDRIVAHPESEEDPYEIKLSVRRDTTFLVRLANVAEDAPETEAAPFRLLFDLGGFYGGPADDPQASRSVSLSDLPEYDTAPGFNVLDGPEALIGCTGGIGQGAAFDFITAAEAAGDVRRAGDAGAQDLEAMMEAMESGDLPIPNATPAQREAFRRARARGDRNAEAMLTPQMRAELARAQAQLGQVREEAEAQATADMAQTMPGRATIFATFTGYKGVGGGQECSVVFRAVVAGEEGGAQTLTVPSEAEVARSSRDGSLPIGIDTVEFLAGSAGPNAPPDPANDYRVCMMNPEEQARERESSCPVVCSAGSLEFLRAEQGHIQGQLRVDLVGPEQRTGSGCPTVDRRTLHLRFNVASANTGQDTDVTRGVSDEMLRRAGIPQDAIDAMRQVDGRE